MEEEVAPAAIDYADWQPISPGALPTDRVPELAEELRRQSGAFVVTSISSRNPAAVPRLRKVDQARRPVLESVPNYMNLPADDAMYQGNQMNDQRQNPALAEADLVLVLGPRVQWIRR